MSLAIVNDMAVSGDFIAYAAESKNVFPDVSKQIMPDNMGYSHYADFRYTDLNYYSELCKDENNDLQVPTINLRVNPTWDKYTFGSPISGSGIIADGSDFAILKITDIGGNSVGYELRVNLDGTFWIFMERSDMFYYDALYGKYVVTVQYGNQCVMKTITYHR